MRILRHRKQHAEIAADVSAPFSQFCHDRKSRDDCGNRENDCKSLILAERVGFEPTIRYNRIPDFESGAFDHSATFPYLRPECAEFLIITGIDQDR